jgi:hypothetical protein
MAELYKGRVVRIGFETDVDGGDVRVLERLLEGLQGVEGFAVEMDTGVLTVYLDDSDAVEYTLVDALRATGIFPASSDGATGGREAGFGAC